MPILDKKKIYNRLPADAAEYHYDPIGLATTMSALGHYLMLGDTYVDNKIANSKKVLLELIDTDYPKEGVNGYPPREWLEEHHNEIIGLEDAKDIYLGMPQRSNTFVKATESPTLGTLVNPHKSVYLSSPTIVDKYLIPAYHNIINKNVTGKFSNNPGDIIELGKSGINGTTTLPILGSATVGIGNDSNKGPYVSYYDKWDIEMSGNSNGTDWVHKYIGGNPFEVYDRIYLNDYYGVPSNSQTSYLPEVTVTPNNRANGGQLNKPLDWNKLSMKEKAAYIKLGVANGYRDVDSIKLVYNEYRNGGYLSTNIYAEGGGTDDSDLVDWLIREEGFLKTPTNIGDGKTTLGSGLTNPKWHKLYQQRGNKWSVEDNRRAVAEEVANRRRWAEKNIPNWNSLPSNSLKALLSYKYNYNFTPENSPKLFKALSDGNLYEAAILMNATSKNPKFKKGLEERRKRELDWFMKDIRESPTKIIVELPAVSTRIDNPFVLLTNNTSITPLMVPDEDAYVKSHRLTKEEDSYNKAAKLLENVIRFNKLMKALNILNNIIPKFIPLFTLPFTNIDLPKALGGNLFEEGGYKAPWVLEAEEKERLLKSWLEQQAEKYAQAVEDAKHPMGHYLNEVVVTPNGSSLGSVPQEAMYANLIETSKESAARERKQASDMVKHIHEGTSEAAKWLAPLVMAPAAPIIAEGLPTLVSNPVTQAAFKLAGRPTSSLTEGLAYYAPSVSKAIPYTVGFDKALMTTLGVEGVKDAATKWYNNEMPWYQAVPQAGLSGLMIAGETAPLISKGVKTAVNAVNSSRIPWVSSIPENENMAYRIMGPLEKDWLLQGNELSTRATNALTEAEEAAARAAVPKGRRFTLFKAGAEHGGRKQFAKGQTWKGTTTTHGEPQVLAIPGKNLPWKSGRHYRGPQGHGFKVGDVSFEEAPFGAHIDLQSNAEGFTGINPSTLEGSTIYSPINLLGHNFGYRTYNLGPLNNTTGISPIITKGYNGVLKILTGQYPNAGEVELFSILPEESRAISPWIKELPIEEGRYYRQVRPDALESYRANGVVSLFNEYGNNPTEFDVPMFSKGHPTAHRESINSLGDIWVVSKPESTLEWEAVNQGKAMSPKFGGEFNKAPISEFDFYLYDPTRGYFKLNAELNNAPYSSTPHVDYLNGLSEQLLIEYLTQNGLNDQWLWTLKNKPDHLESALRGAPIPVETRNTPQIMAGISEQPPLNTVDYTYNPTLNDATIDVFKKMRQKQYQLMLSGDKTFNPTDEYSLINPRDLGTVFPIPDEAKQIILNSTIPRILAMRPWMSLEELNNRLTELTNTTYTEFPEVTLREAYPNDEFMLSLKGAYNPENDFIKLIEGNDANYVMPHEVRHRIDFHEPLVEAEENFLENAYGEVFRNLPNHTKSLKGYKNMEDEMVTTNLDARIKLIGTLHAKKTDPQLLNKIIDKAKDEDIVKAVREANGYGRAFIEQLEASNQLTPERIKAFREAMKYVGMLSVPVVLLQSAQKQKNISNNK